MFKFTTRRERHMIQTIIWMSEYAEREAEKAKKKSEEKPDDDILHHNYIDWKARASAYNLLLTHIKDY